MQKRDNSVCNDDPRKNLEPATMWLRPTQYLYMNSDEFKQWRWVTYGVIRLRAAMSFDCAQAA